MSWDVAPNMYKIFKNILLITLLIIFFSSKTLAETLTYRDTLNQAINNSFDLKISKLDIDISKAELKAARSDLYPMLNFQVNSEHNNDLSNSTQYAYAGNNVITPYTLYRNMAYATVSYNLLDFGVVGKKILIAKKTLDQKVISEELQLKDLKLKILDLYTKTLLSNNEIKTKTEILKVYEEIFTAKERLFQAGTQDKISVMDEAVNIAKTQNDIEDSKLQLKTSLQDLASYTRQKYDPKKLEVLDLDEMNIQTNIVPVNNVEPLKAKVADESLDFSFNPENSPEAKYYNFELEKKKAELDMYKKQRYPAFKLYASYAMYGQDLNHYSAALRDITQRSVTVGVSGNLPVFDGFKNKASREKAAIEFQKLQLQKEKKLLELATEYEKTYASYDTYIQELSIKKNLLNKVKEKLDSLDRMSKNGIIDKNQMLKAKADLLTQEFDLEKNIINISSKIKEIQILTGRDI